MRYQYIVTLKRSSDRAIDAISILLCIFSALNFLYAQLHSDHINYFLILAAVIILAGTAWNIRQAAKLKRHRYKYWLLISGVAWLVMPYLSWLAVLFFLLTFLEYQAKYPLEIGVSQDRIVINTLFKRQFEWSAFSNVILKDGLLTLDFKNNRLIQKEVIDDEEGEADEDEFNDYCRERLHAASLQQGLSR